MTRPIHPIEVESYGILAERIDLSHLSPGVRAVVARVIHASADLEYAETMRVPEDAVTAGVEGIRAGAPVVTDVEMTRAGITGVVDARCYLGQGDGLTRSAAGIRHAAELHPHGAVVVIGCAPTGMPMMSAGCQLQVRASLSAVGAHPITTTAPWGCSSAA